MALSQTMIRDCDSEVWLECLRTYDGLDHHEYLCVFVIILGLHGVPHKGGKYVPQDSNVVVGSSWGATTPASPPKVGS